VAFRQLFKLAPGFHCPYVKSGRPAYRDRRKSLFAELAHLFKLGPPNGPSSRSRPLGGVVFRGVLHFTGGSTIERLFDSLTQVLDEMKSIGALARLRRALVGAPSIEATSVLDHDLDLRMIPKPVSRGSSRSVLKDIDDLTPFEVDNNCSVVVSLPGGPLAPRMPRSERESGTAWLEAVSTAYGARDRLAAPVVRYARRSRQ
jgi:hypothetical protein